LLYSLYEMLSGVFSPGVKITRVHGRPFGYRFAGRDRIVYPTYHPAAALRNPTWHGELAFDIFRAWALLTNEPDVWSYVGRPELHRNVAISLPFHNPTTVPVNPGL